MKFLLAFLMMLTLAGCSMWHHEFYVHPEILPYYLQFEADARAYHRYKLQENLIVTFKPLTHPTVGQCRYLMTPTIYIDPEYWQSATPTERILVLYHELGHCSLKQVKHRTAEINLGTATVDSSIMSEYLIDAMYFEAFRDYYLKELFSH